MADAAVRAEAAERRKAFTAALCGIPKFSGMGRTRWRDHETIYRNWYGLMDIENLTEVDSQKRALLSSLTGPAA